MEYITWGTIAMVVLILIYFFDHTEYNFLRNHKTINKEETKNIKSKEKLLPVKYTDEERKEMKERAKKFLEGMRKIK